MQGQQRASGVAQLMPSKRREGGGEAHGGSGAHQVGSPLVHSLARVRWREGALTMWQWEKDSATHIRKVPGRSARGTDQRKRQPGARSAGVVQQALGCGGPAGRRKAAYLC